MLRMFPVNVFSSFGSETYFRLLDVDIFLNIAPKRAQRGNVLKILKHFSIM